MLLNRFFRDQSGATAIEYGLIVALIGLIVVGALTNLSNVIWNKMSTIANAIH